MADGEGGVTLKIDADTARYIASIAKAADANKKLHDSVKDGHGHMEKLGDFAKEAGLAMIGWSGPLTIAGIAMKGLDTLTENFHKRLDSAKEVLQGITSISQAIIGSGRGGDSKEIREALESGSTLVDSQKSEFLSNYLRANPRASAETIGRAAGGASNANILGRNVGQFGELVASFDRSGIENSGDLANYLQQNVGESTDKAAQAIMKNPAQANEIARYAATAARLGRPGQAMMQKTLAAMMANGGQGHVTDYLNERTAGKEHLAELAFMRDPRNLAAPVQDLSLSGTAAEAMQDPTIRSKMTGIMVGEEAKQLNYGALGSKARKGQMIDAALERRMAANTGILGGVRELGLEANDWLNQPALDPTGLGGYNPAKMMIPGAGMLEWLGGSDKGGLTKQAMRGMTEEQLSAKLLQRIAENTERAPLRPRSDMQGEKAP